MHIASEITLILPTFKKDRR